MHKTVDDLTWSDISRLMQLGAISREEGHLAAESRPLGEVRKLQWQLCRQKCLEQAIRLDKNSDKIDLAQVIRDIVRDEFTGKFDNEAIQEADWNEIEHNIVSRVTDYVTSRGAK